MLEKPIDLTTIIPESYRGLRLDQALAKCFPEHSRMRLGQWIKEGQVLVEGKQLPAKAKVQGGEEVIIHAHVAIAQEDVAQAIPLNIIYEDEDILVINKPANMVVHPGAGNARNTLLNALLHHVPNLRHLPRAGIIHRLDKDTTGLMVIAKTLSAHTILVAALQRREIEREYLALVSNEVIAGGTIDAPMGRHPTQRIKMAVLASGKPAITYYRCHKKYEGFTLFRVKLETGRTHQIRVHLAHIHYPIVGDALYGWRYRIPRQSSVELQEALRNFNRQALHAFRLALKHPRTEQMLSWEAPLPEDFAHLLTLLKLREI